LSEASASEGLAPARLGLLRPRYCDIDFRNYAARDRIWRGLITLRKKGANAIDIGGEFESFDALLACLREELLQFMVEIVWSHESVIADGKISGFMNFDGKPDGGVAGLFRG